MELRSLPLYIAFDEFLANEEMLRLQDFALRHEHGFRSSTVSNHGSFSVDETYRKSKVLFNLGRFHNLFEARLRFYFPTIVSKLGHRGMSSADFDHLEAQITTSNDGEYFRCHQDNTNPRTRSREISFVYFFHREPNRFSGGELCIYSESGEAIKVVPRQNQIVFFLANRKHEILSIECSSGVFIDGRFTLNGWIHRRA